MLGALAFATGCHREEPPSAESAVVSGTTEPASAEERRASASASADSGRPSADPPSSASGQAAIPSAPHAEDSAASLAAAPSGSAVEPIPDPANRTRPPPTSPDLQERAAHLVDALVSNDPKLADDFFFPKAPFIPLKDVADPGRYFDQLLATYHRDVATLRSERKDWTGATFVSFELGTQPTWVAPGKEYNKIGYFRTFGGKLRYRIGDKNKEITVSTIISWDGRWYVTHLSPIKH